MYSSQSLRNRYTDSALQTASGPRVILMAYDRLDRDLGEAVDALATKDLERVNGALVHAQDLLSELLLMLDRDRWEHAGTLASLYEFIGRQLFTANVTKDASLVHEARRLLAGLGDAFREAAVSGVSAAPTSTVAGAIAGDSSGPRWSAQA